MKFFSAIISILIISPLVTITTVNTQTPPSRPEYGYFYLDITYISIHLYDYGVNGIFEPKMNLSILIFVKEYPFDQNGTGLSAIYTIKSINFIVYTDIINNVSFVVPFVTPSDNIQIIEQNITSGEWRTISRLIDSQICQSEFSCWTAIRVEFEKTVTNSNLENSIEYGLEVILTSNNFQIRKYKENYDLILGTIILVSFIFGVVLFSMRNKYVRI
jgi:hypothetical protein